MVNPGNTAKNITSRSLERVSDSAPRRVMLTGMALSLFLSCSCPIPALALFSSKKSSMQLPVNDKIELEALEPEAEEEKPEESSSTGNDSDLLKPIDLSPLSLDSDQTKEKEIAESEDKDSEKAEGEGGLMKATIRTSQFVPKSPLDGTEKAVLAPTSVKGTKSKSIETLGGNLVDQAQSINAAPLPLISSQEEQAMKVSNQRELERQQLTALWEATLTRSPDINFVLQKLMPATDSSKVTSLMMRALSTAMYGGLGVLGAVSPGPGSYMAQNLGYSTISSLLQLQDSKAQKKARVTQVEAIMLYQMVRKTADRLVEKYRDYKKEHLALMRANDDFQDLQKMARDAREGQGAPQQLEIEYTLRKQQRDIEGLEQNLGKVRQGLVDLAGPQAVAKLDKEIDVEFQELHPELVGSDVDMLAGAKTGTETGSGATGAKAEETESSPQKEPDKLLAGKGKKIKKGKQL
ncbi:MAG TPA: hypothetical protein PKD05_00170 [Candidatus Melainabacteria bacterium]|nr:hypothetical protein [Candidatus Melainabacteria bacterium]